MLLMGRNVAHSMIPLDALVKFSLTIRFDKQMGDRFGARGC